MLSLDDPRWREYTTALGRGYDLTPTLQQLVQVGPGEDVWDVFWNYLAYQDCIGEVSYAAVPYLAAFVRSSRKIDWNASPDFSYRACQARRTGDARGA